MTYPIPYDGPVYVGVEGDEPELVDAPDVVEVLARQMIADAVDGTIEWENYPGVGFGAFEEALDAVNRIVSGIAPQPGEYRAAYAVLAALADGVEA